MWERESWFSIAKRDPPPIDYTIAPPKSKSELSVQQQCSAGEEVRALMQCSHMRCTHSSSVICTKTPARDKWYLWGEGFHLLFWMSSSLNTEVDEFKDMKQRIMAAKNRMPEVNNIFFLCASNIAQPPNPWSMSEWSYHSLTLFYSVETCMRYKSLF